MAENQPDGSYPRLNGEMIHSGIYNDMIVSVIGHFIDTNLCKFQCCDEQIIDVVCDTETVQLPETIFNMITNDRMVFEIIGMITSTESTTENGSTMNQKSIQLMVRVSLLCLLEGFRVTFFLLA